MMILLDFNPRSQLASEDVRLSGVKDGRIVTQSSGKRSAIDLNGMKTCETNQITAI
jgi:hypothetical protein